jgi:long-chain fatty acid transport protein
MSFTKVQGKNINTFQYEYLRIIGFPAITEKHISVGVGYCTGKDFALNIGYTHGFKKKITEKGLNFGGVRGMSVNLSSEIKINTFEFGLSYRF